MRTFTKLERGALALALLAALQGVLVRSVVGAEHLPPLPDLDGFTRDLGPWQAYSDVPVSRETQQQLGADQTMERLYYHQSTGFSVDLFVAWFRSQRGGVSQPHSPKVCLPGAGWLPIANEEIPVETELGVIPANRYVVKNRDRRAVVLYWYQTPRRVVASEWLAKFFTIADGLRDRRTDTAIVRIFIPSPTRGGETQEALNFARRIYPLLRETLPR